MFPEQAYGALRQLAKGVHKSQAKAFVAVCGAFVLSGQARSFAVARKLAGLSVTRFKSALQRYYRWVDDSALDTVQVWRRLAESLLLAAGRRPVVAVDWTEWHNGKRVLAAGVCLGKRAVPVLARALSIATILRSQNAFEDAFVRQLRALCPLMQKAVLVFDRGFRRVSLIRNLLLGGQPFVLRLMGKVHVAGNGYAGLLSKYPLQRGQRADLGVVEVRQHRPVRVRVMGIWAPHQDEPWWLATSLTHTVKRVAQYYDRRMTVEEMFRDSKGSRFGMQLFWTRFTEPERLDRLFLLAAVAVALWTAAGVLALRSDPTLALPSKSRGARRSLVNIGRLETTILAQLLESTLSRLQSLLLPMQLRHFGCLA